jgi:hypothetical protein
MALCIDRLCCAVEHIAIHGDQMAKIKIKSGEKWEKWEK